MFKGLRLNEKAMSSTNSCTISNLSTENTTQEPNKSMLTSLFSEAIATIKKSSNQSYHSFRPFLEFAKEKAWDRAEEVVTEKCVAAVPIVGPKIAEVLGSKWLALVSFSGFTKDDEAPSLPHLRSAMLPPHVKSKLEQPQLSAGTLTNTRVSLFKEEKASKAFSDLTRKIQLEIEALEARIKIIDAELLALQKDSRQLEGEISRQTAIVTKLKTELDNTQQVLKLHLAVEQLNQHRLNVTRICDAAKAEKLRLTDEIDRLQDIIDTSSPDEETTPYAWRRRWFDEEGRTIATAWSDTVFTVLENESEISAHHRRKRAAEIAQGRLREQYQAQDTVFNKAQSDLTNCQQQMSSTQRQLSSLLRRIGSTGLPMILQSTIAGKDKLSGQYKAEVAKLDSLKSKKSTIDAQAKQLSVEKNKLTLKVQELNSHISESKREYEANTPTVKIFGMNS